MRTLSLLSALIFSGCATTRESRVPLTGNIMVDGPRMIAEGPKRDKVLWQYRTAAAAMRQGNFDMARQLLDDALLTLGGVFGPDRDARKARGYFHAESKKTFIGEPYERAMAYFYRGVLYWRDGELDNARACFRSAEFEDSDAEEHQFKGDWVLPDYLDGLATVKLGGDGSDQLKRARAAAKNINLPDYQPKANVLFIVEFGPGPTKYTAGEYNKELHFRTASSPVIAAHVVADNIALDVAPCDDLNFQATTRGGRVMDHILGNKAVFKSSTDVAGNVGIISGAILAGGRHHSDTERQVGLGLLLAGLLAKGISASTIPEADARSWENLPQFISFAAVEMPPGQHTVTVRFTGRDGKEMSNLTKAITVNVEAGRDKLVFVSDNSTTPQVQ